MGTMKLRVPLSQEELVNLGNEMLEHMSSKDQADAELEGAKADHKAQVKLADAQIETITQQMRTGYVRRDVEIHKEMDYENGIIITTRKDTDEEVSRRAMEDHERQKGLPLDGAVEVEDGESVGPGDALLCTCGHPNSDHIEDVNEEGEAYVECRFNFADENGVVTGICGCGEFVAQDQ